MSNFPQELGRRLREAREYCGFTQDEAARHVGLHRPAYSLIEQGKQHIRPWQLLKLADLYSKPVTYFTNGEEAPPPSAEVAAMVDTLSEEDRAEVLRFAEFLAHKARCARRKKS